MTWISFTFHLWRSIPAAHAGSMSPRVNRPAANSNCWQWRRTGRPVCAGNLGYCINRSISYTVIVHIAKRVCTYKVHHAYVRMCYYLIKVYLRKSRGFTDRKKNRQQSAGTCPAAGPAAGPAAETWGFRRPDQDDESSVHPTDHRTGAMARPQ